MFSLRISPPPPKWKILGVHPEQSTTVHMLCLYLPLDVTAGRQV